MGVFETLLGNASFAHAATRCEVKRSVALAVSLGPLEAIGSSALAITAPNHGWIAVTALSSRFARRPRTRVIVGEFDPSSGQWLRPPVEVHSLAGRNERRLAMAANESQALILLPSQRSITAYSLSAIAQSNSTPLVTAWPAPNRSAASPRVGATADRWAVSWLSESRVYHHSEQLTQATVQLPTYVSTARRGAIALGAITAIVPLNTGESALAMALHSGAVRLVALRSSGPTTVQSQLVHCPSHCTWVATQATNDGFVSLFRMSVHGESVLGSYWLSRVGLAGNSHSTATIPLLDAWPVTVGPNRDAILQLARPPIVRAIERPLAVGASANFQGIPHSAAVQEIRLGESAIFAIDDSGSAVISQIECQSD